MTKTEEQSIFLFIFKTKTVFKNSIKTFSDYIEARLRKFEDDYS